MNATILRFTDQHALISTSINEFSTSNVIGYIKKKPVEQLAEKESFDLPSGWVIENKTDIDGNVLVTKDNQPLSFFVWKSA